jgi:hypothetical protein
MDFQTKQLIANFHFWVYLFIYFFRLFNWNLTWVRSGANHEVLDVLIDTVGTTIGHKIIDGTPTKSCSWDSSFLCTNCDIIKIKKFLPLLYESRFHLRKLHPIRQCMRPRGWPAHRFHRTGWVEQLGRIQSVGSANTHHYLTLTNCGLDRKIFF